MGPFSQKPWQPVPLTATAAFEPSSSASKAATTPRAPVARQPVPAQTETRGSSGSRRDRTLSLNVASSSGVVIRAITCPYS